MNFSSLVLIEKDRQTNQIVRELESYEVSEGVEYIKKMYYDGNKVNIYFDTNKDVEEWEYSAIFDLFNYDEFTKNGYNINDIDDEYNPTWLIKMDYCEEYEKMKEKIVYLCALIKKCVENVFNDIKDKKQKYE